MAENKTLLEKLQEKRLKAVHDARAIVERSIDGDMSGEDEAAYTKANEDIDRYGNLIDEEVKRSEAEAEKHGGFDAAVKRAGVKHTSGDAEKRDEPHPERAAGYVQKRMAADLAEKRGGGTAVQALPEWRDLLAGTANKGAEVVPVTLVEKIYSKMFDHSAILDAGVSIIRTSSGETMKFPRLTALNPLSQTNSRVAEGGPLQEADPSFDQVQLDAYKYGQFAQISRELVSDGVADVEGLLAFILSRNIADNLGIDLTNGTGSGQPRGIRTLIAAGSQKVTVAGGALSTTSFDDYFDTMAKVHRSYRKNGKWLVNDATIFTLRKVKMNGVYAWEPNLQGAGNPDSFCGYPVMIDQNVPVPAAASGISLIFGDFSAYMVRLVGDVRVEWSTEYAWVNDLLSVKAVLRGDGDAIDDAAFAGVNMS